MQNTSQRSSLQNSHDFNSILSKANTKKTACIGFISCKPVLGRHLAPIETCLDYDIVHGTFLEEMEINVLLLCH